MANRAVVLAVALFVGLGGYAGLVAVENLFAPGPDVAASDEAVAANTTMHLDRVGRPTVVGQVVNGRPDAVTNASLTVQFLRDGEPIGTASGRVLVPTIGPGERAPFAVRLENQTARPDDFEVALAVEPAESPPNLDLTVAESSLVDQSQTRVIVDGTVRNGGDRTVGAHVVVTFFDAGGAVVGVRAVRPSPSVLAPGDEAAFTVRFRTLGNVPSRAGQTDRYEITVYAEPVE